MKLIIFILCSLIMSLNFAADGKLVVLKGEVKVNERAIKKKAVIKYGDVIDVLKESLAVVKLSSGSLFKLKSDSRLKIIKPTRKDQKTYYSYVLDFGEIFLDIKKNSKSKHRVQSKNATLGVRGTKFFVSSEKSKKKIWMCVNEGEVSVFPSNNFKKYVIVKAGEGVVVDSDKLPEVKKYKWTKKLNWKFSGTYEQLKDETNIRNINYKLESFEYD